MFGGVLRLVEYDDGIIQSAAAHECERGDLDSVALHVFLEFDGGYHIFEGVVERSEIRVDLIFHVAGEKTEFFAGLDGWTGEYDSFAGSVFESGDSEGDGNVGLAGAGGAEGECKVIFLIGTHHAYLIGIARGDRSARLAENDDPLGVDLLRRLPLDDVNDGIVGELVVFGCVGLDGLDFCLEFGSLRLFADDFDDAAAGCHAQFREEIAYEIYI